MQPPPAAYLADVYRHLPFLVVHVTTDGIVLHCNPEALKITGYDEQELIGKNFWATLFPGKLFAQVPKFISLVNPPPASALLKDVPMTIRTRQGRERVIAWSRYAYASPAAGAGDNVLRSFICIGVDLTDRLLDADRFEAEEGGSGLVPFGPHVGNAGSIEGEIVTPIAISPRVPDRAGMPCAIEQVREGLARVETHIHCVQGAFLESEIKTMEAMAAALKMPCRGDAVSLLGQRDVREMKACGETLGVVQLRVGEMLKLYRPELG